MSKIWVYGTLKKGYHNHHLLDGCKLLGKATSEPVFSMLHLGGFPGIVRGGETTIHGEVYEVDADTLTRLDRLEGHPNFYERQPITVRMEDGSQARVEGYVLPPSWLGRNQAQVASGIWGER